jgi:hypothetical protein
LNAGRGALGDEQSSRALPALNAVLFSTNVLASQYSIHVPHAVKEREPMQLDGVAARGWEKQSELSFACRPHGCLGEVPH